MTVEWHGDAFKARMDVAWLAAMEQGAIVLQASMKRNFGSEGGGIVGKTKTGGAIYKSSPPGRFPGWRTGDLSRSISYQVKRDSAKGRTVARVGTNEKYGRWLESGTARMEARPWAKRGYKIKRVAIGRAVFRELARQMERGGT